MGQTDGKTAQFEQSALGQSETGAGMACVAVHRIYAFAGKNRQNAGIDKIARVNDDFTVRKAADRQFLENRIKCARL